MRNARTASTAPLSVAGSGCGSWKTARRPRRATRTRAPRPSETSPPSADLAELFRVGHQTIAKWERLGRLPRPIRVGRESRWTRERIDAFLRDGGIAAAETAVAG
jgi:hypothetical protein